MTALFPGDIIERARRVVVGCKTRGLSLVTAESCTGGLIAAAITEIPGASDIFERGLVTYSNEAKVELLSVAEGTLVGQGAVSEAIARAMAEGAIANSAAALGVAVTGIAGPGGGTKLKPVGLVHIAAARDGRPILHEVHRFGDIGRSEIRLASVEAALRLLRRLL
jgi:nicotinamide-nucleotide amidase